MPLKALFLNCTLKKSPQVSHTGALIRKVQDLFHEKDVETEVIRVADYDVAFGV